MTSKARIPRLVNLALVGVLVLLGVEVRAADEAPLLPRYMRLEYLRPVRRSCPEQDQLEDAVIANAKRDPFKADARAILQVTIARGKPSGYGASVELRDDAGKVVLDRPVAPVRSCDGLVQDLGFLIGDMLRLHSEPAPAPPQPAPPALASAPPTKDETPPRPASVANPLRLNLGIAGAVAIRTDTPAAGFNLVVNAGLRWRAFSGAVEFRWTPPEVADVDWMRGSWLRVKQYSEGVVLCGHVAAVVSPFFCGAGHLTEAPVSASPGIVLPRMAELDVAAGGRIGADLPFPWWERHVGVRLTADVLGTLWHTKLQSVGQSVPTWTPAPLTIRLGPDGVTTVTFYAEPSSVSACPLCTCSAPACVLPVGLNASSASTNCQGPAYEMFLANPNGACSDNKMTPIPVNAAKSLALLAPTVRPCAPKMDIPQDVVTTWKKKAMVCSGVAHGNCDGQRVCVPSLRTAPSGFMHCIENATRGSDDGVCPPKSFPNKITVYERVDWKISCGECACDPPVGSDCTANVSAYTDPSCIPGSEFSSQTVPLGFPQCVTVPPNYAVEGVTAHWITNKPGVCVPSPGSGQPTGTVDVDHTTAHEYCCQAPEGDGGI